MAAIVNVQFDELKQASFNLNNISEEMKIITETMSKIIDEIGQAWRDDNGKKFTERFKNEVQSKFEKYYGSVKAYSDFIKGAHDTYVAQNEQNLRAVNSSEYYTES